MVPSGFSGYPICPDADEDLPDNDDVDLGSELELDAWPEALFDTGNSSQAEPNPTPGQSQGDYGNPVSSSQGRGQAPTSRVINHMVQLREGNDVLWFEFGADFKCDTDLEMLYPDEEERMIATLGRDLHVILTCNVQSMIGSNQRFKFLEDCLSFSTLRKPDAVTQSISDVISSLKNIMIALQSFKITKNRECKASSSSRPSSSSPQPGEVSPSNDILFHKFPSNYSNIFLSKLIARYTAMTQCLPSAVVEIADYCVSRDTSFSERETLYADCGGVVVFRKDMYTLDIGVVIAPVIVCAWSRVLSDLWLAEGIVDRICFDVVDKDALLSEDDMVDHWVTWIGGHMKKPSDQKPDLIFIPMFISNHHNLLVVNFPQRKVLCYDSVYWDDTNVWEKFTAYTVKCLWRFLVRVGDNRGPMLGKFEFLVVNPSWSFSGHDLDSGLTVMHMMETYLGHPSNEHASLREEHIRARMRISYISQIVMSDVNLRRMKVYDAACECVEKKCCNSIAPSKEVTQYRGQFRWVRNC